MKGMVRILSIALIITMVFAFSSTFAGGTSITDEDKYTPSGAAQEIQDRGVKIINAVLWFGYAISLGMVIYIGIKYMLGAAEAKANMKTAITTWLIGAFVVFMATTIIGWVLNVIGVSNDTESGGLAEDIIKNAGEVIDEKSE